MNDLAADLFNLAASNARSEFQPNEAGSHKGPAPASEYVVRRCGGENLWAVGFWFGGEFFGRSDHESEAEAERVAAELNARFAG